MSDISRKSNPERQLLTRLALGPFVIVAVFFAFQRDNFLDVWKPLALYAALAVPAIFALRWLRRRAASS